MDQQMESLAAFSFALFSPHIEGRFQNPANHTIDHWF